MGEDVDLGALAGRLSDIDTEPWCLTDPPCGACSRCQLRADGRQAANIIEKWAHATPRERSKATTRLAVARILPDGHAMDLSDDAEEDVVVLGHDGRTAFYLWIRPSAAASFCLANGPANWSPIYPTAVDAARAALAALGVEATDG